MPAHIIPTRPNDMRAPHAISRRIEASVNRESQQFAQINIGIINNMPDGALETTERQFLSLLNAASGSDLQINIFLYSLQEIHRGAAAQEHIRGSYLTPNDLWSTQLDGLIVTGREPVTSDLSSEPYWDALTDIYEWARRNTYSTIWSCLAAHAAVLYSDGIRRVKSLTKLSGVFECDRVSNHPLTSKLPARFAIPHSRWNGLLESDLYGCGFSILSRAPSAGIDAFFRCDTSLFIYFQGHPEYSADTILCEYRRDVNRYLAGTCSSYPSVPRNYFSLDTERKLREMQLQATHGFERNLMEEVMMVLSSAEVESSWKSAAICIYASWLQWILERKHDCAAASIVNTSEISRRMLKQASVVSM